MEINYVLLVSIAIFAIAIFLMARDFYLLHKKDKEILRLKKENISLLLGKKKSLNYKEISEILNFIKNENKEDFDVSLKIVMDRSVEDVNSLNSYLELKNYMKDYEKIISEAMLSVHQNIINKCSKHVGELFDSELSDIKKSQLGPRMQLRAVDNFIKELSILSFTNFKYQSGNLNAAKRFKKELTQQLESGGEAAILPIGTKTEKVKTS